MRLTTFLIAACAAALSAVPIGAAELSDALLDRMREHDVVILGEVHDNPDHHAFQAEAIKALRPKAVVWEMLTPVTADRINAGWLEDETRREEARQMAQAGWPNFDMYQPLLDAGRDIPVYGGLVRRESTVAVMEKGLGVAFGSEAAKYGLMVPLPADEQAAREADQFAAHCEAIPEDMLPRLVDVQRLRDAVLAQAVIRAEAEQGRPVAVITGNGHARRDRGIPVYLARVAPGLRVLSVGQSEEGRIDGVFDVVLDSPAAERDDPCAVFDQHQSKD